MRLFQVLEFWHCYCHVRHHATKNNKLPGPRSRVNDTRDLWQNIGNTWIGDVDEAKCTKFNTWNIIEVGLDTWKRIQYRLFWKRCFSFLRTARASQFNYDHFPTIDRKHANAITSRVSSCKHVIRHCILGAFLFLFFFTSERCKKPMWCQNEKSIVSDWTYYEEEQNHLTRSRQIWRICNPRTYRELDDKNFNR